MNRKHYVNNAARPYDDDKDGDDSWEEEQDDDDEATAILFKKDAGSEDSEGSQGLGSEEGEIEFQKALERGGYLLEERVPARFRDDKVDFKREKNRSNQVFALGQNREDHKKLEAIAKQKRNKKKGSSKNN